LRQGSHLVSTILAGGVSKIWVLFFKNTFNNLNNGGVNVPLGTVLNLIQEYP